ncbi:P-type ATPase [Kineococcus sp. NUM-3379]
MVTPPHGLDEEQVRQARRRHGRPLRRAAGGRTYGQILRANLFTLVNNVLFGIGLALLALGRYGDAVVSAGLGLLNALIGAVQEMRAKRELDALKRRHGARVRVVRDGREAQVAPEELVVGDLVCLEPGEQVLLPGPVEGPGRVEVDEPGPHDRPPVSRGAGEELPPGGVVVAGSAHQRVRAPEPAGAGAAPSWRPSRTPLQQRIDQVVRVVILAAVLMGSAILAQALMEGLPLVRVVQISAVLTGLVPSGLFLLVTLSYSAGAARIARHGVLVQQVNAVESLSNVDVLCSATTGTLTTGRVELSEAHPLHPAAGAERLRSLLGALAHGSSSPDPVVAALREALPGGTSGAGQEVREEVAAARPGSWSGVVLDGPAAGADRVLVLGDAEVLRPALAGAAPPDAALHSAARAGLRVRLLARAADPGGRLRDAAGTPTLPALEALALVTFADELRPGAAEALAELRARGVRVVLLSEEGCADTAAVAARLGLPAEDPVPAGDVARAEDPALEALVARRSLFCGTSRRRRERVVEALLGAGHYVAVAANSAADSGLLRRAHVGIATRSGSGGARDAADVLLLEDSYEPLPLAHREGQRVIGAIPPVATLFLTRVAVSMGVIVGVAVLGLGFPYEPAQGSLTLFTVGVPTLFLTAWARPQRPDPHLIGNLVRFVVPAAVVTGGFAIALYAAMFTILGRLTAPGGHLPEDAWLKFEAFTGLARDHPDFAQTTATAVAQMGLSFFACLTGFLLVLFLEPPTRFFTGWAPVSRDRRPALLVACLLATLVVVLSVPALARWFGLVQPGGFEAPLVVAAAVVWFFVMRTVWRRDLFRKVLGLPPPPG